MSLLHRLPPLNALRAFEVVARRLSFSRAAEELHVTKAAVAQQVRALEQDVGARLVERNGRGLQLTESGAAGAATLSEGFALIAKAARAMREGRGRRFLVINSTPSFAATWLVGRIGKFKARHPETDVLIDADPIDEALESGAADALIRWGAGEFPDLAATLLFKEDVFPVCAPELVAGTDLLRSPEDLSRHTLLHLDWNPAHASWPTWSDWLKAAGARHVEATHGVFFNNMAMTLRAAAQGQGVALTSFAIAADEFAADQGLARVPDPRGGAVGGGAGMNSSTSFACAIQMSAMAEALSRRGGTGPRGRAAAAWGARRLFTAVRSCHTWAAIIA
jgi:LysR family transcriptional regulator, glycine cleavage system transcriptional activator